MGRGRAGTPSLLLALVFCLCCSDSFQIQEPYHLSPPVNLSITSHNFHTVLKWDVVDASRTSRFNVDFRDYESGEWKPFPPCLNISMHHCDLSEAFKPPLGHVNSYYARINAVTMSQTSNFSCTDRFSFSDNATLGPPRVHLTANGNKLTVKVKCADPNSTASSIKRAFKKLTCNIYYWKREAPKPVSKKSCSLQIIVEEGVTCVSAEVQLDKLNLKGKRSQETCLLIQPSNSNLSDSRKFSWSPNLRREAFTTPQSKDYSGKEGEEEYEDYLEDEEYPEEDEEYPEEDEEYPDEEYPEEDEDPKDTSEELEYRAHPKLQPDELEYGAPKLQPDNTESSRVAIAATIGGIVIFLLVFAIIYVAYKFNKKELELPKSLAHIILGGKTYTSVNIKTEESSISVVTKLEEVVTNVCEVDLSDERQVEMIKASSDNVDADPVNADVDDSEPVNADLNDPYAAKIDISGTDQKSVREDNIEVGNSDLDSTHDLCKTNSDNMKQICVSDNWGYDKPQIPFDVFLNNCTDSVN